MRHRNVYLSFLVTIGLVVGFGVLGFWGAGWLIQAISTGLFAQWTPLGTPPGKAAFIQAFAGASNHGKTVVRTADGQFFQLMPGLFPYWSEIAWPYPARTTARPVCPPSYFKHALPPLPRTIVDCDGWFNWEWSAFEEYYAVLADGSVWRWQYGMSMLDNLLFCAGGPLFGMVVGFMLSRLIHIKKEG